MNEILKIVNDISIHYGSNKTYDKKDLVKLFLDHSSFRNSWFFLFHHMKRKLRLVMII